MWALAGEADPHVLLRGGQKSHEGKKKIEQIRQSLLEWCNELIPRSSASSSTPRPISMVGMRNETCIIASKLLGSSIAFMMYGSASLGLRLLARSSPILRLGAIHVSGARSGPTNHSVELTFVQTPPRRFHHQFQLQPPFQNGGSWLMTVVFKTPAWPRWGGIEGMRGGGADLLWALTRRLASLCVTARVRHNTTFDLEHQLRAPYSPPI